MAVIDTIGAFCPHGHFALEPIGDGQLAGLTFAAKDLIDVAGHVTGAGNPCWLETHAPAASTAPCVTATRRAGAMMIGKTITDELAYSVHGDNVHYGTPMNPKAPDRVPGGSSSGSAAAVAAGLCDFALATDTGGSIRIPDELLRHFRYPYDAWRHIARRRLAVHAELRHFGVVCARPEDFLGSR
jgi:amidase